jgi:hypothetical protein
MLRNKFLRTFALSALLALAGVYSYAQVSAIVRGEISAGNYENLVTDGAGHLAIAPIFGGVGSYFTSVPDSGDALSTNTFSTDLRAYVHNSIFNGSTWDRWRGAASGSQTATGSGRVNAEAGYSTSLNITAATNVKASAGRVYRVVLNTPGSTVTTVCNNTSACAAATTVLTIPIAAVAGTIYELNFPMSTGIRVEPGTSAVLAVSFD